MPLTYSLRNALYVALTNRCNAKTLVASRGPSFRMPQSSGFGPLLSEPSAHAALAAIEAAIGEHHSSVCFAGLGEPLLRLAVLDEVARGLKQQRPDVPIRLTTNGLVSASAAGFAAATLRAAGIDAASVALASADATQWASLVCPEYPAEREWPEQGIEALPTSAAAVVAPTLSDVCAFVRALIAAGVEVECATVAAPGVSVEAARELAIRLGARFRSREWFPP